jgi:hypothetical protein
MADNLQSVLATFVDTAATKPFTRFLLEDAKIRQVDLLLGSITFWHSNSTTALGMGEGYLSISYRFAPISKTTAPKVEAA